MTILSKFNFINQNEAETEEEIEWMCEVGTDSIAYTKKWLSTSFDSLRCLTL
jgi:hypothetical protein